MFVIGIGIIFFLIVSIIVDQNESVVANQFGEPLDTLDGPVIIQDIASAALSSVFDRQRGVGQIVDGDGSVVVLGGEQAEKRDQFALRVGVGGVGSLNDFVHAQVGIIGEIDVAREEGPNTKLPDFLSLDLEHRGGEAVEEVIEEDRAKTGDLRRT